VYSFFDPYEFDTFGSPGKNPGRDTSKKK